MQKAKGNFTTLLKILKVVKGKKRYIYAMLFIHIFQSILSVGYALFFRNIIDAAVAWERFLLINNVVGLAVLALTQLILRSLIYFLGEYTRATVENQLKKHLFVNLLKKDYSLITATHSGEWLNRLTNDTVVVAEGLTNIIPGIFATIVRMVCAFTFLAILIPKFALLLMVIAPVVVLFTAIFRKISKKLHTDVQTADGNLRIFLTEQMNSLMVLKAYGREDSSSRTSEVYMKEHKAKRMHRNFFLNIASSGFSFVMSAIRVLAALYSGFAILNGVVTYGTFTAVLQLLGQIQGPMANISAYAPRYYAMLASADRVFELDTLPDEVVNNKSNIEDFYAKELVGFGFKNATFSYGSLEDTILQNIDIDIKKGEFVAFVGPSGCGKSTVLKLLLSIYDLSGGKRYLTTRTDEIELDATFRQLFAYVPQGNVLMNSTIRDVVAFFDKSRDEDSIDNALKIACADEFISRLPDGIYTHLGERGAGLSEGEMQRISIARAICSDRPILLFDESTSALDEKTEEKLLNNIKTMTDKTVILVTHRAKTLSFVERIVVLGE